MASVLHTLQRNLDVICLVSRQPMCRLRCDFSGQLLQDVRMLPFLSRALTGDSRERVLNVMERTVVQTCDMLRLEQDLQTGCHARLALERFRANLLTTLGAFVAGMSCLQKSQYPDEPDIGRRLQTMVRDLEFVLRVRRRSGHTMCHDDESEGDSGGSDERKDASPRLGIKATL